MFNIIHLQKTFFFFSMQEPNWEFFPIFLPVFEQHQRLTDKTPLWEKSREWKYITTYTIKNRLFSRENRLYVCLNYLFVLFFINPFFSDIGSYTPDTHTNKKHTQNPKINNS